MRAKNCWNNFELRSGCFSQSWLWWINRKVWYFFLVLLHKPEVSDVELLAKKPNPCCWRNLTTRIELNQTETHSLDVSHCWIFNAAIKKSDCPIQCYAIIAKFLIEILFGWKQPSNCSYRESIVCIQLKQFQNPSWSFRAIKVLMGQSIFLTFFSCCLIQLGGFRGSLCWEKNKPIVTKNFDVEKRVKQT